MLTINLADFVENEKKLKIRTHVSLIDLLFALQRTEVLLALRCLIDEQ